jgi:hypothetical protein
MPFGFSSPGLPAGTALRYPSARPEEACVNVSVGQTHP